MAVTVTLFDVEFVKPIASQADCSLKDGQEGKPQLASKVSMSEENLINEPQQQTNWRKKLEISLLICVILIVCAPFATPTILYALPPLSSGVVNHFVIILLFFTDSNCNIFQPQATQNDGHEVNQCEEWKNYTGDVCFSELMELQSCYNSYKTTAALRVPSDTNQEETESVATRLSLGLPFLSPSPECEAAIRPFLCLYLFGSCDTDNQLHQITQKDCETMRDDVCAREWALGERYLGQGILPDCSTLSSQEDECQGIYIKVILLPGNHMAVRSFITNRLQQLKEFSGA